tara:strand:+ start:73 stop:726 length:654 start_codon:yes stop_codon:yes gene_type:complete
MKEIIVSSTNILMFITFLSCFVLRNRVTDIQKKDYSIFAILGMVSTALGFYYHLLKSQGQTREETQLIWDCILYITVFMSFFYTSVSVRIFSSSQTTLRNWKIFCKVKAFIFIIVQYNMHYFRPDMPKLEIVIFLISSLLPVGYILIGSLINIKKSIFWGIGCASFFYILTTINRIVGKNNGDFNEVLNGNSLMHVGIVILLCSIFLLLQKDHRAST